MKCLSGAFFILLISINSFAANVITNGGFEDSNINPIGWYQFDDHNISSMIISDTDGIDSSNCLVVSNSQQVTKDHMEVLQSDLLFKNFTDYTGSIYLKAESPGTILITLFRHVEPWTKYGLWKEITVDTNWKKYNFDFRTLNNPEADPLNVRFSLQLGEMVGKIWIDEVEIYQVVQPGDINNDGIVSLFDVTAGLKTVSGVSIETVAQEADVNGDKRIGLEEVIYSFQHASDQVNFIAKTFEGYVWLVSASFTYKEVQTRSESQTLNIIPYAYNFAICVTKDKQVFTTDIHGFDPTKGILRQNLSKAGEIPGINRPSAKISNIIPKDTSFSFSESEDGKMITLKSDIITILADDSKNPIQKELQRTCIISINKEAVLSYGVEHGSIIEKTEGFLNNSQEITSVGDIYLVPYRPVEMAAIEN